MGCLVCHRLPEPLPGEDFELCSAHATERLEVPDPLAEDFEAHWLTPAKRWRVRGGWFPFCDWLEEAAGAALVQAPPSGYQPASIPPACAARPDLQPLSPQTQAHLGRLRRQRETLEAKVAAPESLADLSQSDRAYAEDLIADGEAEEEAVARAWAASHPLGERTYQRVLAHRGPARSGGWARLGHEALARAEGTDG